MMLIGRRNGPVLHLTGLLEKVSKHLTEDVAVICIGVGPVFWPVAGTEYLSMVDKHDLASMHLKQVSQVAVCVCQPVVERDD
ncbi:hypothetical protein QWY84_18630 [Aquisalimonas lutea]|uniref:hypothetical protein n=1 Tax=Aquisalimonas lutea TaxID=1327750 RepID=UPI0025B4F699|nr:hypothetical protein [Aquisalimonas lutea]MDN3519628.1 hypothetical protein [Aquisalimonas lutea]